MAKPARNPQGIHAQVRLDISPTIFQDALRIFMQAPVIRDCGNPSEWNEDFPRSVGICRADRATPLLQNPIGSQKFNKSYRASATDSQKLPKALHEASRRGEVWFRLQAVRYARQHRQGARRAAPLAVPD